MEEIETIDNVQELFRKAQKLDSKGKSEEAFNVYIQVIEKGYKIKRDAIEIGESYYHAISLMIVLKNYEKCEKLCEQFLKWAQEINSLVYITFAYGKYVDYNDSIKNEKEYKRYLVLYEDAKDKRDEEHERQCDENDISKKARKAKVILKNFMNASGPPTKKYTQNDVKEVQQFTLSNLIENNDLVRFAEKAVYGYEVMSSLHPNTIDLAKSYQHLAEMACYSGMYDNYDPEIGDYAYNWFEKSIKLFRNIDESHNDFYGLLSLAGNLLKGFVKYEEISKQYQLDFQELLKKNEKKRLEKDKKVDNKIHNLEEAKEEIIERLDKVEFDQNDLLQKYELLELEVNNVKSHIDEFDIKISELEKQKLSCNDNTILSILISREKDLKDKQIYLKKINKNSDLKDYYNALSRELEAVYIGARAVASGKVQDKHSNTLSKAAKYASYFIEALPFIGKSEVQLSLE